MSAETVKARFKEYRTLRNEILWFDALFILSLIMDVVAIIVYFDFPGHPATVIACGSTGFILFWRAGASTWWERMKAVTQVCETLKKETSDEGLFLFDTGKIKSKVRQFLDFMLFIPLNILSLSVVLKTIF